MTFPPGDITLLDNFNRANGNVWDGAGSTLWSPTGRYGNPSHLRVIGNQLKVDANGGGATTESVADFIRIFKVTVLSGGFGVSFGYRLTDLNGTPSGYWWTLAGGTWKFYRIDDDVFTEVGSQSTGGLFTNSRVGIRAVGGTHEVFLGSALSFPDTPEATFTDSTYLGAGAVVIELDDTIWTLDDYSSADMVAPTTPVTIIVDPDHGSSSDLYSRGQASNSSTPLKTVQQAGWLARATPTWADTILVKHCTTADLGDAKDPHIQPKLDYRSTDRGTSAAGWPFGNNAGNQTIVVRGDVTPLDLLAWQGLFDDGPRPKIKSFSSRDLNNWSFEDLQFGYDVDSGDDYNTFGEHERCTDLAFRRCLVSGGLAWVRHWTDSFVVERCWIRSPFPPLGQASGVHDACGCRFDGSPAEGTGYSLGQLHAIGNWCEFIRGDDTFFIGGVDDTSDPLWSTASVLVELNCFSNINGDGEFHDDSVQVTYHPNAIVDRNIFMACDTGFMATDGHCGYLQFTRNLTVGMPTPVQIQGADEVYIAHNTCSHADSTIKNSSLMFYDRTVLAVKTLATIVNNVIGGFYTPNTPLNSYFRSGSVIADNIVQSNPGLVTSYGTNLAGVAEFGHSARLDVIPNFSTAYGRNLDRYWELSNSPVVSPGIGQGRSTTLTTDFFGRTYTTPPDAGAFQSSTGTLVTPVDRPPYIVTRFPVPNAVDVSQGVSPFADFYPKPGETIDASTVSTLTAYVYDVPSNTKVPAVVTIGAMSSGVQRLTIDLKKTSPSVEGFLWRRVVYGLLLDGIQDTAGQEIVPDRWFFTTTGPAGAAIDSVGAAGGARVYKLQSGAWVLIGTS